MLTEGSPQISTAGFPTSPARSEPSLWWNYQKSAGGAGKSGSRYSCPEDDKLRSAASNKLSLHRSVADLKKKWQACEGWHAATHCSSTWGPRRPGSRGKRAADLTARCTRCRYTPRERADAAVSSRHRLLWVFRLNHSGSLLDLTLSYKKNYFPYRSFAQPALPSTFLALQTREWDLTTLTQPGLDYQLLTVATLNTCAIFSRCCLTSIYCTLSSIYCAHWIVSAVVLRKQSHVIHAVYAEYTVQGFRNHSS